MKRILFHPDVVVDVLLKREPHWTLSASALDSVTHPGITGYISGHSILGVYQTLCNFLGVESTRQVLRSLLQPIEVVPTTKEMIQVALLDATLPFEEALIQAVANRIQADGIITYHGDDINPRRVPVFTPSRWITVLSDPKLMG